MPVKALPPQGSASTNFATWAGASLSLRLRHYARNELTIQERPILAWYDLLMTRKHKSPKVSDLDSIPYVGSFLAVATFVAVLIVALETLPSLASYQPYFNWAEYVLVAIFGIEYLVRIYQAPSKPKYIFSFFGLIDLIAILPSLLGFSNLTFLKAGRAVRIIRLLRMLRLAKLSKSKKKDSAPQSVYLYNIEIYVVALTIATLLLGSLFYIFEHSQAAGSSIPSGMYWSLKVILGGIAYPQPETFGGSVTMVLTRLTSLILLGLLINLAGTIMRKVLTGSEKDN
jgi:voltage-gated potassium channel